MTDNQFLNAALFYATRGFKVFPCVPRAKNPLTPNGYKDASNDPAQIKEWWTQWPNANIGLPTGKINGLFVIDLDGGCPDEFQTIKKAKPTVKTRRGFHYYMAYPVEGDMPSKGKLGGFAIDIQSDGKYVIVPPSVHPEGGTYEFID